MMRAKNRAGFTLIELMVVAIIVAVLAAVAIPLMSANKKRAAATEAEAGLGSVRSAMRAMFAETGAYNLDYNKTTLTVGMSPTNAPGVGAADLDGTYFKTANYSFVAPFDATHFTIQVTGSTNAIVSSVTIKLDQDGNFTRSGF